MLSNPKLGQKVRLHYAKNKCDQMPCHGLIGTVRIVSRPGTRPRNHGIDIPGIGVISVPCGNIRRVDE